MADCTEIRLKRSERALEVARSNAMQRAALGADFKGTAKPAPNAEPAK